MKQTIIGICGGAGSGKDTTAGYIRSELSGNAFTLALADPLKEFVRFVFGFDRETLWGASSARNEVHKRLGDEFEWTRFTALFNSYFESWAARVLNTFRGDHKHSALCSSLLAWFKQMRTEALAEGGMSARRLLQTLGTECGRAVDQNIWVNYAMTRAKNTLRDSALHLRAAVITDVRFKNEAEAIRKAGGEVWYLKREAGGLDGQAAAHASEQEIRSPEMQALVTRTLDNVGTLDELRTMVSVALNQTL